MDSVLLFCNRGSLNIKDFDWHSKHNILGQDHKKWEYQTTKIIISNVIWRLLPIPDIPLPLQKRHRWWLGWQAHFTKLLCKKGNGKKEESRQWLWPCVLFIRGSEQNIRSILMQPAPELVTLTLRLRGPWAVGVRPNSPELSDIPPVHRHVPGPEDTPRAPTESSIPHPRKRCLATVNQIGRSGFGIRQWKLHSSAMLRLSNCTPICYPIWNQFRKKITFQCELRHQKKAAKTPIF